MKVDLQRVLAFQTTPIIQDEDFLPFPPFLPVDNISLEAKDVNIEYTQSLEALQIMNSSLQQLLKANILIFLR